MCFLQVEFVSGDPDLLLGPQVVLNLRGFGCSFASARLCSSSADFLFRTDR